MTEELTGTPSGDAGYQSLRHQMEQTRSSLAGKLESLQRRMTNTVDSACDAVDETVHSAKKSALDAVQAIKSTLDLKQQASRHPWAMVSVATCIGALLAKRTRDGTTAASPDSTVEPPEGRAALASDSAEAVAARVESLRQEPVKKKWLSTRLQSELGKLQDAAIGAGANIIRDWMEQMAQRFKNKTPGK